MDSQRFKHLLQNYLRDELPKSEVDELMEMVRSGGYDTIITTSIDSLLAQENNITDMSDEKAKAIFESILSENRTKQPVSISMNRWWLAAASVVLLAVCSYWWFYQKELPSVPEANYVAVKSAATFSGKQYVHLPDGSTVLLNQGSSLSYSKDFGDSIREVNLSGEGYFDIAHDFNRPFLVRSGEVVTTVLGTAFNITAYPEEQKVKVTVTRGKVRVDVPSKTPDNIVLKPQEQITVNTLTYELERAEVPAGEEITWKKDYLIFDDMTLAEATAIIEDKYRVDIKIDNDRLENCSFTATFLNNESLDQVITVVTGVLNSEYTYNKQTREIHITGEGCK